MPSSERHKNCLQKVGSLFHRFWLFAKDRTPVVLGSFMLGLLTGFVANILFAKYYYSLQAHQAAQSLLTDARSGLRCFEEKEKMAQAFPVAEESIYVDYSHGLTGATDVKVPRHGLQSGMPDLSSLLQTGQLGERLHALAMNYYELVQEIIDSENSVLADYAEMEYEAQVWFSSGKKGIPLLSNGLTYNEQGDQLLTTLHDHYKKGESAAAVLERQAQEYLKQPPWWSRIIKEKRITVDRLRNLRYDVRERTIQLIRGEFEFGTSVEDYIHVWIVAHGLGDLDGDGDDDAAVILASQDAGIGVFYELLCIINSQEGLRQVGSFDLGDRIKIDTLEVINGEIRVQMITHGPKDSMCCPKLPKTVLLMLCEKSLRRACPSQ